jgi:carbonic anhydrase
VTLGLLDDTRGGQPVRMSVIDEMLAANEAYVGSHPVTEGARPSRGVAVLTCRDVRVDPRDILGLSLGEAHVLRNAGARVTIDVLRGLSLSTHALGAQTMVIMQHTGCGVAGTTEFALRRLTGAALDFRVIDDHERTLLDDLDLVTTASYLYPLQEAAALLYDVDSGRVTEVARWTRET